jgi:hypothetical protein
MKCNRMNTHVYSQRQEMNVKTPTVNLYFCFVECLQVKSMTHKHKTELAATHTSLEKAEREVIELKKSLQTSRAPQAESSAMNKRMQMLKTQKEATQHRAEVAEGKLVGMSSQLTEVTKANQALGKEKVLLEKKVTRLEKEKEKEKEKQNSRHRPEGDTPKPNEESKSKTKMNTIPVVFSKDFILTLGVATVFLYLGTVIGPLTAE